MRAVIMRSKQLVVDEFASPEPGPGKVLVKTLACGICGSDLHALRHGAEFVETSNRTGNMFDMDLQRDVVMGHEFCAAVVDHGVDTQRTIKVGTPLFAQCRYSCAPTAYIRSVTQTKIRVATGNLCV
jgi:threonine dehydrogenase-like Zn-dependent dehydrogenase